MEDITKKAWAPWLEETIKFLAEDKPAKIAMAVVMEDGSYAVSHYNCGPVDLYAMAGMIQSEGTWKEIQNSGHVLREIIESEDDEEDVDG